MWVRRNSTRQFRGPRNTSRFYGYNTAAAKNTRSQVLGQFPISAVIQDVCAFTEKTPLMSRNPVVAPFAVQAYQLPSITALTGIDNR